MSADSSSAAPAADAPTAQQKFLFWACFASLIATAFGFIVRTQVINEWGTEFGLTETQKGEILGVGLWPFAISIVLFLIALGFSVVYVKLGRFQEGLR